MASKTQKAIKISQKHLLGIQDLSINDVNLILDESQSCLLYTSDAADDSLRVDLGGRRIIKKVL